MKAQHFNKLSWYFSVLDDYFQNKLSHFFPGAIVETINAKESKF